ncbi:MAG: methyltransferase domain-containing protein [Desulfarculaceae bacterium]|nr:methyltransferase domain-containing protein [Desulfarculaceae bacterium]MCF8048887.1 methyltransferase domain-containing protein [Desulfarculaceae bacterium]MCF8064456.1 methyltransferase domain-containing protein [Desulfarculaceae bacterium]MCF8122296.1 methyltransferase domain-containing protein [Desulfarculaceae bacterium]
MEQTDNSGAVDVARDYYNSGDADNFYYSIWGGEDIHIGLYRDPEEDIATASRRTVLTMASRLEDIGENTRVLDLGAGFGGAARWLAQNFGCRVTALNLSEVQNQRDRQMNREQGLDHLVEVVDASFEDVPKPDDSYDIIWSQDAILHSPNRTRVMDEVRRVLKPEGQLVFTDPMAADDCPPEVLQPILDRIHLENLGSPGFYRQILGERGFQDRGFDDHTEQLVNHYTRVLQETERREEELRGTVSQEYINNMKRGLSHWAQGGQKGYLAWGIFSYKAA